MRVHLLLLPLLALPWAPAMAKPEDDARALVQLMQPTTEAGMQIGMAMSNQFVQLFKKHNPGRESELIEIVNNQVQRLLEARLDELEALQIELYVDTLTPDELSGLVAFYQTELGRSLLAKTPELMLKGAAIGQSWGMEVGQQAAERIMRELEQRGFDTDI